LFGVDQGLYWFIVFAVLALVSGLIVLIIPMLLAPRHRSALKESSFEAGQLPPGEKRIRFALQYYAYLLLFLVFDVTIMILFVWSYAFFTSGQYGFVYQLLLLVVLIPPLLYTVKLSKAMDMW
jgi:NADH:ubiquinone oxidoreductase subunit 3 (subunit A)